MWVVSPYCLISAFTNLQKIRIYLCLSVFICGRKTLVVPIEVGIAISAFTAVFG
ncbi:hypothetical protein PN454_18175 [Nodularia spumigena CS-591/07A]|nr:hypothetical protein [Nodularia spumigena CS-591/07A]